MSQAQRQRIFYLAGKPSSELTQVETDELFRLFATWNAWEQRRERDAEPKND